MNIGIWFSDFLPKNSVLETSLLHVCDVLKKKDISIYFPEFTYTQLTAKTKEAIHHVCILFDVLPPLDMMLSIGGDGTFLRTASYVGRSGIPIIGINTGRLGFLADISLNELENTFDLLLDNRYDVEERTLLSVYSKKEIEFENVGVALNEVAVMKQDTSSMISVHAYINNEYLTSYQADGILVSTSTGSTAYSLSIGGPILVPDTPNFILGAIAPHSLTTRPLIIPDTSLITLKVESRSHNYLVSIDGNSQIFSEKVELHIRKADFTTKVIKPHDHTFFKTLREKLMWGMDVRK